MSYSDEFIEQKMALIAHEIKTPMVLIKYYAEFIKETDSAEDRARFTDAIMLLSQEMIDSSQFMLQKISSQQGPFTHVPVSTNAAIFFQKRIDRFEPMIKQKKLNVSHNFKSDLTINIDPIKLRIITNNLLSNAIKFSPVNGHISLSINHNTFCITDTAECIPEAKRDTIFKPHVQLPADQSHSGFGLGLSNCQQLVASWEGKIWTEPAGKIGNKFFFTLPV